MRPRPLALLVLAVVTCAVVAGCGNGSTSTQAKASPDSAPTSATPAASPLASQSTDASGNFFFPAGGALTRDVIGTIALDQDLSGAVVQVVPLGPSGGYRIVATLRDGTTLWTGVDLPYADSAALGATHAPDRGWIWVTPISHLAASYQAVYGVTATQAVQQVKHFLKIDPAASINRPFISKVLSQFAPRVFFQAAAQDGGLQNFTTDLMARIRNGEVQPYIEADPIPALRATKATEREGELTFGGLGTMVSSNVFGNVLASPFTGLVNWGASKIPLGQSTTSQLSQISSTLTQISNEISQLSLTVVSLANLSLYTLVTNNAIVPLGSYITTQQAMDSAIASTYSPWTPGYNLLFYNAQTNQGAGANFINTLNQGQAFTYASYLVGACLNTGIVTGQGNLVTAFNQSTATPFGSQPVTWAFFYDFRNDAAVTPSIQDCVAYYIGCLAEASNMLQESYNRAINDSPYPSSTVTSCQRLMLGTTQTVGGGLDVNGVNAMTRRISQQAPLSLLGGTAGPYPGPTPGPWPSTASGAKANAVWAELGLTLPDGSLQGNTFPGLKPPLISYNNSGTQYNFTLANGTFWAASGYEFTSSGTKTNQSINTTVQQFELGRTMGWYIPTGQQCQQLASRARQVAAQGSGKDPVTQAAVNVSGNNAIPYGLMQLGLLSYANWKKSPGAVRIYCNYDANKSMQVYDSTNNSVGGNGIGDSCNSNGCDFRPQGGDLAIVLLVRPFPGAPLGADVYTPSTGFGDGSVQPPSFISNSASYQAMQLASGTVNTWQSTVALAGNFPPSEIVVTQQAPTGQASDPHQLHAYAIWPTATDPHGGINEYLVYAEVTDAVEWLSSNNAAADVSNFAASTSQVSGGTVTGASLPIPSASPLPVPPGANTVVGAGLMILNPVLSGGSIGGGTIANLATLSGTVNGGSVSGSANITSSFSVATIAGGTISAGTITPATGVLYNLFKADGSGTRAATMLTGANITNATINGGVLVVPSSGRSGFLSVHDPTQPVTITASLMYNANSAAVINPPSPSNWSFVSVPGSPGQYPGLSIAAGTFAAPTLSYLVISPNNIVLTQSGVGTVNQTFYLTGFLSDGTTQDLSTSATWQVLLPTTASTAPTAAVASFSQVALNTNVLQLPAAFTYTGDLIVVATTPDGHQAAALISVEP